MFITMHMVLDDKAVTQCRFPSLTFLVADEMSTSKYKIFQQSIVQYIMMTVNKDTRMVKTFNKTIKFKKCIPIHQLASLSLFS